MTTDRYIYGLSEDNSESLGKLVKLVKLESVELISAYKLRIHFDRPMKINDALSDTIYYTITPFSFGGVTPYISGILLPNVLYPTYVDLIISEMTGELYYFVTVNIDGPIDTNDLRMDEYYNTLEFESVAVNPTVKHIEVISDTRLDVVFTENMTLNDSIRDPSNYTFDNGLIAISILDVTGDVVKLVTSMQISNVLYTLTVSP